MFKEWWVWVDSNHRPHPYQGDDLNGHNTYSSRIQSKLEIEFPESSQVNMPILHTRLRPSFYNILNC